MSSTKSNILIFGGTGIIGRFLTAAILDSNRNFNRIAIFTSEATQREKDDLLRSWREKGLEVITGDINKEEDVVNAYQGFDTVVSAVGRNVIASQINLLRLAETSSSVKRFFPSEYGTDIEYNSNSKDERPHQQKLKVRAYIRDHIQRLEYTYLVTGPYADLYISVSHTAEAAGSFDVKAKRATLLGDGNGRISLTTMADVGKLLVAALLHPKESRNRALVVNSFTTTPHEILNEFKKQSGNPSWNVSYTPLDELKRLEREAWDNGSHTATVFTLRRLWTEGATLYEGRDNGLIEALETDTLQTTVERALGALI